MNKQKFQVNQEVIIDGTDLGEITLADYSEQFYLVKSQLTGTVYLIEDEKRLESVAYV